MDINRDHYDDNHYITELTCFLIHKMKKTRAPQAISAHEFLYQYSVLNQFKEAFERIEHVKNKLQKLAKFEKCNP